jgi:hypothetical protein
MNCFLLTLMSILLLGGCSNRPQVAQVAIEPDTEWIIEQYNLYGEVATNERRIREGW